MFDKHMGENGMAIRYTTTILAALAVSLLLVLGSFILSPEKADAASGGYVKTCTGGKIFLKAPELRSLQLHNQARRDRGLRTLCIHPALQKAARAHSADMINKDYFSHTSKDGRTAGQRLRQAGYNWRTYGENIAWGSGSRGAADPIFKSWMNSSGHRANILNGKFREVGIGIAVGNYKGYNNTTMWTADFGTR